MQTGNQIVAFIYIYCIVLVDRKEIMMLDLKKQAQVMHARLAKYGELLPRRDAAYQKRKLEFSIPRANIALARIQSGLYGICTDCGEEIGTKRLEAVPAALLCIECQKEFEEGRHR